MLRHDHDHETRAGLERSAPMASGLELDHGQIELCSPVSQCQIEMHPSGAFILGDAGGFTFSLFADGEVFLRAMMRTVLGSGHGSLRI